VETVTVQAEPPAVTCPVHMYAEQWFDVVSDCWSVHVIVFAEAVGVLRWRVESSPPALTMMKSPVAGVKLGETRLVP
jgi:hypothetical protein